MHYLVWFGLEVTQAAAEVTIALSLVWDFQKGILCRGKYALFGLVWFGGHHCNVLGLAFSKRYIM